ncbi:MAG: hypothetical protein K2Q04_08670 [Hyphomicrobium sp.]|nr:hypothetical protein [Hyphomicrobium sp.]
MFLRDFQLAVKRWTAACFGETISADTIERNHRFLEEALELVQSLGCTRAEAKALVDYVYDRPVGEPMQELGGTMTTLCALANAHDFDVASAAGDELARCWANLEKIRAKQAAKPKHSPLPGPSS